MSAVTGRLRRMQGLLTYRGREGQWSWFVHRLAGLGVVSFLALHVVDIWLMLLGEQTFNHLLVLYTWPPFKVLEVFLIFGLLFHAVNGLRIIIIDFVPGATRYHRQLFWAEVVIIAAVVIPAAVVTLEGLF